MHVCFLTHEYPLPGILHGGVGSFVKTLGKKLVEQGVNVSVVGAGYQSNDYTVDEGINVYTLQHSNWQYGSFIKNSLQVNKLIEKIHKKHPINILESAEIGFAFIKKHKSIKQVIRMHGGHHFFTIAERRPREKWKVFQEKRSFYKADAIVAVSQYVADVTSSLLDIRQKVQVIYNPVNLQSFPEANPQKEVQNRLLFVGTICEKKGIRQLVQALPIVKEKYPSVELKVVGREWKFPKTGKSYTDFLKLHIDPAVKKQIHFVGAVPNNLVPRLIEEAEICIFPSHMEAMPIAWIEALAMGKPVVGSKEGPGPEAIQNKKTGLLADPYDPNDIAEKIMYLLAQKEAAKKMGKAARADILHRFDIDKCVVQNIAFYKSLLNQ